MRHRKLSLKKETVAELTPADLSSVAGGIQTKDCTATAFTCDGPCHSDFQECLTGLRCLSVTGC